ncbi:MAG: alanine racemase [Cyclobacteriaceae bacterium]
MEITRPTVIIDEQKAKGNINRMAKKVRKEGLTFRPHFKTHQSCDVGKWYKDEGVSKCAVSSLTMADYFATHGWKDITVAFPFNLRELETANALAEKIQLNVLVESEVTLDFLKNEMSYPIGYFVKIDVGYGRTGLALDQSEMIQRLVDGNSDLVRFKGMLAHAGHTYACRSKQEILSVHNASLLTLQKCINEISQSGIVSYGDTPSCSVAYDFGGVDEVRCGNFIYYDLTQAAIGSCKVSDIAVTLACPIVAKHENRNELVIYGGGVHLSKDKLERNGQPYYGQVVTYHNNGWNIVEGAYVSKLSQEHGIISLQPSTIDAFDIGGVIGILPVHSCLMIDLCSNLMTLSGQEIKKLNKK